MSAIRKSGIKHLFFIGVKLAVLSSFICSQLFLTGIFLHPEIGKGEVANAAQSDNFAGWYDGGYLYRKKITIDHTKVANTDQTDFPVVVSLTDANLKTVASGGKVNSTNGYDIIFVLPDGLAKLDYEIESYNAATGAITMWVKLPSLSSSADTVLYMYYGNSNVTTSQENKTGVWDSNFRMVQHMSQNPTGTAPQVLDSTVNGNNGTISGAMAASQSVIGNPGKAFSVDGINDYISLPQGALNNKTSATISAWFKTADTAGAILSQYDLSSAYAYRLSINSGQVGACIKTSSGGCTSAGFDVSYATNINDNIWHLASAVYDGSDVTFYVDGVQRVTIVKTGTITYDKTYGNLIGSQGYIYNGTLTVQGDGYLNGSIDEVHISDSARSADWVKTEYNNQVNPTGFYAIGAEEDASVAPLSNWQYRKAIVIDHTKVNGDLSNFPIFINIPSDFNLSSSAQANGDDILFALSDIDWATGVQSDKLSHEIESYDSATGELQAWVRIPNLSSVSDTTLYMYYGNASATNQQDGTSAWGADFRMVQHMNQDPSGTAPQILDSTINGNNGISNGSMSSSQSVSGQMGKALNFDGSNDFVRVPNSVSLSPSAAITLEAWTKPNDTQLDHARIIDKAYNLSYSLNATAANKLEFQLNLGGVAQTFVSSGTFTPNSFNHVAATYNGSSVAFYINGASAGSYTPVTNGAIGTNNQYGLTIAANTGAGNPFNGIHDEVRVSSTARSSEWISTEYNNQSSPSTFAAVSGEESYMDHLTISGSATQTAGSTQTVIVTARDSQGNINTHYSGSKSIILSGANAINDFTPVFTDMDGNEIPIGISGTLSFVNGIATTSVKFYKAEAVELNADDGVYSTENDNSYGLGINISPSALYRFEINAPQSVTSEAPFSLSLIALDSYGNIANAQEDVLLSLSDGKLDVSSVNKDDFIDGEYSANITISEIYSDENIIFTVKSGETTNTESLQIVGVSHGDAILPQKPNVANVNIVSSDGKIDIRNLPANICQTAISISEDFKNVSWEALENVQALLQKYINAAKLYFKFRSKDGGTSDIVIYENENNSSPIFNAALNDGDIVKTLDTPDVYIIKYKNGKAYRRLILSPSVFNSYQHLRWENIKTISWEELDKYTISNLVQVAGDNNIYELFPDGDFGKKKIMDAQFYDKDSVYEINNADRDNYILEK